MMGFRVSLWRASGTKKSSWHYDELVPYTSGFVHRDC